MYVVVVLYNNSMSIAMLWEAGCVTKVSECREESMFKNSYIYSSMYFILSILSMPILMHVAGLGETFIKYNFHVQLQSVFC